MENGGRLIGIEKRSHFQIEQPIPFRIMQNINYKLQLAQQNIHKKDTVVQTLLEDGVQQGIHGFFLQEPYWGHFGFI
jgi:hypothetical protein